MCRAEDGGTAVSAWTRAAIYSHPFQALELDVLSVPPSDNGCVWLQVVVCLLSRWLWVVPCRSEGAEEVAHGLVVRVLAPFNVW